MHTTLNRIFSCLLIGTVVFTSTASGEEGKSNDKIDKNEQKKPDTVTAPALKTENDKLCYGLGFMVGQRINKSQGITPKIFFEGIRDNVTEKEPKIESYKTRAEKQSYVTGFRMAQNIKVMGAPFVTDLFVKGYNDRINGSKPAIEEDAIMKLFKAKQKELTERFRTEAAENQKKGQEFLKANGKKEGVKTTGSGLQYKVIKEGEGNSPTTADKVRVHYEGKLIDGKIFDSSYKRKEPTEFPLGGVIPGWKEGLQLMKPGAEYQFFIPANLAYGTQMKPGIPPNSVLIFTVELLKVLN